MLLTFSAVQSFTSHVVGEINAHKEAESKVIAQFAIFLINFFVVVYLFLWLMEYTERIERLPELIRSVEMSRESIRICVCLSLAGLVMMSLDLILRFIPEIHTSFY
jgi:hypothetical protein